MMKRALPIFPMLILLGVFLRNTTGEFQFKLRHLLLVYLLFGLLGFAWYTYRHQSGSGMLALSSSYTLVGLFLVGFVIVQDQGIQQPGRGIKLVVFLTLFLIFLGLSAAPLEFLKVSSGYLLAFGILFGVFLIHAGGLHPGSGLATFPILAGLMMGLNLFIAPRYLSRQAFLWMVCTLSTVTVLLGLPAYMSGTYQFLSMEVGLRNSLVTVPLLGIKLHVLESVFANPNTLGILTFAGTFAAFVLARRVYVASPVPGLWLLPSVLVLINGIGLYLSYSRAGYLALAVAVGLYATDELLGRAVVPYAFACLTGVVGLFLLFVGAGVVGVDAAGRFVLWGAGVQAILDNPSLFGAGIIDPAKAIAPYIDGQFSGQSPHNSYLSIFIRAGLAGGVAYLILTVGSVLHGVFGKTEANGAMLAFAAGFMVHQLFEAYTLFQFSLGAVLASLVFGYLILDGIPALEADDNPTPTPTKTFDRL